MALASLAFSGCSQNEIMEVNPDANAPIGFGVYTETQTRGLVTDNSNTNGTTNGLKVTGKGFGVMAYLTKNKGYTSATYSERLLFMDNPQVTFANTAWTYAPTKYWPNNGTDKISFFAYAPYTSTPTSATDGIKLTSAPSASQADPTLTFTLLDQKKMVDLVVSTAQLDKQKNTVTFDFKHVLSKIAMQAKLDKDLSTNEQTRVYITNIQFEHTTKLSKTATINMNSSAWAYSVTSATTDYLPNPYVLGDGANTGTGILNMSTPSWHGYTTKSIQLVNTTAKNLFVDNQYLFFIPVNNTGLMNAGDVKLTVEYDIVTIPSGDKVTTNNNAVASHHKKTINLANNSFAKGAAYLYTLTIGMNEIKLDVTDFNWNNAGSVEVPVQPETII